MPERKPVSPAGAGPNAALSPGMIVGDLLFVSGHVAVDTSGDVVGEGDAEAQTRQVMANIRDVVSAAGAKMEDVAKITCFITDIAYYPAYSKVRAETWPKDPPASSTVVVTGLVRPEVRGGSRSYRPPTLATQETEATAQAAFSAKKSEAQAIIDGRGITGDKLEDVKKHPLFVWNASQQANISADILPLVGILLYNLRWYN